MSDPLLETTFATFEIRERIKPGGMAIVYKAYDTVRKQIIALKVLQESLALHDEIVSRFNQEVKIAQRLRHPHIVQFFDNGQFEGRLYIAMQYMSGGSLADVLTADPVITLRRTSQILTQIGSALDYAHHESIVHRDLKLGNILLDDTGETLLTDFGIARLLDATQPLTMPDQQMPGTVKYMSPEQVMGRTDLDFRSDLYSFAVIGYLLATGRYPFTGTSDIVVINQHLNMTAPEPTLVNEQLPRALNDVLLKGLAKNPESRYPSAGDFAEAFEEAITGFEEVTATVDMRAENPALPKQPEAVTTFEELGDLSDGYSPSTTLFRDEASIPQRQSAADWFLVVVGLLTVGLVGAALVLAAVNRNEAVQVPMTLEVAAAVETQEIVFSASSTRTLPSSPTLTSTRTSTPTSTPTFTSTAPVTPALTASLISSSTPSLVSTTAPTSRPTFTRTSSQTPTPLFRSAEEVIAAFKDAGTQSQFNCRLFVEVYGFLSEQVESANPTFDELVGLVDAEDDALREVYTEVCQREPQNTEAFIDDFTLYGDLSEALDSWQQ